MLDRLFRLCREESGVVTVEYALLLALLVVAALGTWTHFGEIVRQKISEAGNGIDSIR